MANMAACTVLNPLRRLMGWLDFKIEFHSCVGVRKSSVLLYFLFDLLTYTMTQRLMVYSYHIVFLYLILSYLLIRTFIQCNVFVCWYMLLDSNVFRRTFKCNRVWLYVYLYVILCNVMFKFYHMDWNSM